MENFFFKYFKSEQAGAEELGSVNLEAVDWVRPYDDTQGENREINLSCLLPFMFLPCVFVSVCICLCHCVVCVEGLFMELPLASHQTATATARNCY